VVSLLKLTLRVFSARKIGKDGIYSGEKGAHPQLLFVAVRGLDVDRNGQGSQRAGRGIQAAKHIPAVFTHPLRKSTRYHMDEKENKARTKKLCFPHSSAPCSSLTLFIYFYIKCYAFNGEIFFMERRVV